MLRLLITAVVVMLTVNPAAATDIPDVSRLRWQKITFGQSTDIDFATNVLADKIGVNDVTVGGKKLPQAVPMALQTPFTLESRGGKIGNSHDGLTFYYTTLPVNVNFVLQATVTVSQFGPENGAKPAGQEGVGMLVRDVIGQGRQEQPVAGYEEFPASANQVMNAILTQDKRSHTRVQASHITRTGSLQPAGNQGVQITRQSYQPDIDLAETPSFRLRLERTDQDFVTGFAPLDSEQWVNHRVEGADLVAVQRKDVYYLGFFAARNARMTVDNVKLSLSAAHTVASKPKPLVLAPLKVELASSPVSAFADYAFQLRANRDGRVTVRQDQVVLAAESPLKAGDVISIPATLHRPVSLFSYVFTDSDGRPFAEQTTEVSWQQQFTDGDTLWVSPQGLAANDGTASKPLDFATAVAVLPPGGTILLQPGEYPLSTIPATASGSPTRIKTLKAAGEKVVFHGLSLSGHYWMIANIEVTGKSFHIAGSHNHIDRVIAHHADDTGIWVSSPEGIGRALWASHNLISNSESFANKDPGNINADGFAVKMRVGAGNRVVNCIAHDNADDGFDLFNKIEDGPNGQVVIENSIALNNTNNGFKLGGEGQSVAHRSSGNLAVGNGMDGFTDNFNPGQLAIQHNIALDNKRFNFIFRQGPYNDPNEQGVFKNNISLRTSATQYNDVITGHADNSNFFYQNNHTINNDGIVLNNRQFISLSVPEHFSRQADGAFELGDFLKRR